MEEDIKQMKETVKLIRRKIAKLPRFKKARKVKGDFSKIDLGIFKIYWNDGGWSLASVGMTSDGTRWYAPSNWTTSSKDVTFKASTDWSRVKAAKLVARKTWDANHRKDELTLYR